MASTQQSDPGFLRQPGIVALLAFNASYMAIATFVAASRKNGEFAFYLVVMVLLAAAVIAVHRRISLSQGVLWGLSIWGLAHMAGGLVAVPESWPINGDIRVLYSWWLIPDYLKYDHVVHAFGFGVTTWLCWQGLCRIVSAHSHDSLENVSPTLGMLTLAVAAGMGFGAMNEVVEFVATLMMPETNVGGYINTGWDLVSNLTGCVLAAGLIRLRYL